MVPIELDKTRHLHFDIRAIQDLESRMGQPLAAILGQLMGVGVTAIVTCLWAGLKHEDPSLTVNLVTKMLQQYLDDKRNVRLLARALNKALVEDTGILNDPDDVPEGNGQTTEPPA